MYGFGEYGGMGQTSTTTTVSSAVTPSSFLEGLWTAPGQFLGLFTPAGVSGLGVNGLSALFYGGVFLIGYLILRKR